MSTGYSSKYNTHMKKMPVILRKVAVRLAVAAVFAVLWYFVRGRSESPGMAIVFMGVLYLAIAWFT